MNITKENIPRLDKSLNVGDNLSDYLRERLTILKQDIPENLTVDDFVLLKGHVRNKKNTLKGHIQHDFEVKLFKKLYNELEKNPDWINTPTDNDTIMGNINNEINLKKTCEKYIVEQFIGAINKINTNINEIIKNSDEKNISGEESSKILSEFLIKNNLEMENKLQKSEDKQAINIIKSGKMAILAPDTIQKDINKIEENLKIVKVNRKLKAKFNKMKNRYEIVIKSIDENYKDKENKYDTIKMLDNSAKPQFKEIINDMTMEIKNQKNKILMNNTTPKEEKLYLNKDILDKKRKIKKELPKSMKV